MYSKIHRFLTVISLTIIVGFKCVSTIHATNISTPSATPGDTSVTISWTTDVPTDSCIKISERSDSLSVYQGSGCGSGTKDTSHSVTISYLGTGVTYYYATGYQDPSPSYYFPIQYFTTTNPAATQSAITFNTYSVSVNGLSAKISWNTSAPTDSCLRLGKSSMGMFSQGCVSESGNAGLSTSHARTVSGLSVATYYYSAGYTTPLPGNFDTAVNSFTVTSTGNITLPSSPILGGPSAPFSSPINLHWTYVSGATEYRLYRRTPPDSGTWNYDLPVTPVAFTGTTYSDASVLPGIAYQYSVAACNSLGCSAVYNYITVTMPGKAPVATPVPTPAPLTVAVILPTGHICIPNITSMNIQWQPTGYNFGLDHYTLTYWESSAPILTIGNFSSSSPFTTTWTTTANSNTDYAQIKIEALNSYEYTLASDISPFFSVRDASSCAEMVARPVSSQTPTTASTNPIPAPNPQIPSYQKYPNSTLLRALGDQKVWIITNGFKRYVVGPQILSFYGHLAHAPIIDVPAVELAQYKLAAWVRYVNDPKVYEVNDDATKHWLNMSAEDFYITGRRWEAVFIVNKAEIDFYKTAAPVTVIK